MRKVLGFTLLTCFLTALLCLNNAEIRSYMQPHVAPPPIIQPGYSLVITPDRVIRPAQSPAAPDMVFPPHFSLGPKKVAPPPEPELKIHPDTPQIRPYVHLVILHSYLADVHCSGTAIAPYAILLASHCEEPGNLIRLDTQDSDILKIEGIVRDDHEHTILYLSGMEHPFKKWANIDFHHEYLEGEDVFSMGNPATVTFLLRKGYLAQAKGSDPHARPWHLYKMDVFHGDSGSAVFDSKGHIIDVISMMANLGTTDNSLNVMCAYPLQFTEGDLANALAYKPPPAPKKIKVNIFSLNPDDDDDNQ